MKQYIISADYVTEGKHEEQGRKYQCLYQIMFSTPLISVLTLQTLFLSSYFLQVIQLHELRAENENVNK